MKKKIFQTKSFRDAENVIYDMKKLASDVEDFFNTKVPVDMYEKMAILPKKYRKHVNKTFADLFDALMLFQNALEDAEVKLDEMADKELKM